MAQRLSRRAPGALRALVAGPLWAVMAAVLFACGGGASDSSGAGSESVIAAATTGDPAAATSDKTVTAVVEVGQEDADAAGVVAGIDGTGLVNCEGVPKFTASEQGPLRTRQNYPSELTRPVWEYGDQFDTFGGYWLDRDNGGTVVVGFTDDVATHEAALTAQTPSASDGPVRDMRPLGERGDIVIEVVQVRYSRDELLAAQEQISHATWQRRLGIYGLGIEPDKNRVALYVENPPPGAIAEIAEAVPAPPGLQALCIYLAITAPAPDGPLLALPDLGDPDPIVRCWGAPPMPYSQLTAWRPVDEVAHPAVAVFKDELEARISDPTPRPLAQGDWAVVHVGETLVHFVLDGGTWEETAVVERRGDRWYWAGESASAPCEPAVVLPEGLGRVDVHLDPDRLPSPDSTEITLFVTERGCASGRYMGDALRGPQVVETDEAVVVAFAVVPVTGGADCPGNPATSVTITLDEPLGVRAIADGLYFPPKHVTIESP